MGDYVFGANIIENLTTGMYQDSRVIYREYIQNSCDQIDVAWNEGLLKHGDELIDIQLDEKARTVSIRDNATGISSNKFREVLTNIADSDKHIEEAKGFRGIGRLCGLAYCKELVFSSKAAGENHINRLICDAYKMRQLITKNNHGEKITAEELLNSIYEFKNPQETNDIDSHWFEVDLIGINEENKDLLNFQYVKNYLSFVAPVTYQNKFIFRNRVSEHAKELGETIDEYTITLNGEPIYKSYGTKFKTSKGDDEIFDIEFKDFYDASGDLLAWSWYGLSKLKAVISKDCQMRGLRLRKENIQIGDDDSLKKLFKEDRGTHYFVGEVFAVSDQLIPNSQRDYFNENSKRLEFEQMVRSYFNDELTKLYREGSDINSSFNKIDIYEKKKIEFEEKKKNGDFVSDDHLHQAEISVQKAKENADKARKKIEKKKLKNTKEYSSSINKIINRIEEERKQECEFNSEHEIQDDKPKEIIKHRVDKLSSMQKRDRKLLSKVYEVVYSLVDEETADRIVTGIEEAFK